VFRFIVGKRWWVVAFYALILGPSVYFAVRVPQDNSIDRLIVQTDPDYVAARDFAKVFGNAEYAILLAEADDPFSPAVLQRLSPMEERLAAIPQVSVNSILAVYRRAKAGFTGTPEQAADFKRFATGTDVFARQHLYGEHFLAIPLVLSIKGTAERSEILSRIDAAIADVEQHPAPLTRLRKIGQPYVNAYLDQDTRSTGLRYFPLFFLFVTVLCLSLYRSWRTLLAFVITLALSAALTVGFVGATGGVFTIVSSLVPMTILITCTATLVYLHSRFVERPPESTVDEHQLFALSNKFLACTASIFAAAVGFAALAVSKIRPIREMGLWVAAGLVFTWLLVFTLFPALQKILRTPTRLEQHRESRWFIRFVDFVPQFSYRFRWPLVLGAVLMCGLGAVALWGIPGHLAPMTLQTNAIEYINHDSDLYKNTKELEHKLGGLAVTNVWLVGEPGSVSKPEVLRGLIDFQDSLQNNPAIGSAASVVTILRTLRYLAHKGDKLPTSDEELEQVTDELEALLPRELALQRFVDKQNLAQTHYAVVTRTEDYQGFVELQKLLGQLWAGSVSRHPALKQFKMRTVGLAPLQAKISYHMVPTLVESFGLTVAIIFGTFLLVFRSGVARLMAMIPSFFAILVMFLTMRLVGVSLNVATILIASTVLGTSENDQIHFFYHFGEKRQNGTVEQSLRHTLLISGRAIFYATLINAGGFLAFALAKLPPVRQFGALSALAFVLSMIADFTALPAALWLLYRAKPDAATGLAAAADNKTPTAAAPPPA
jgi:predicted RND superfamily exporter protein